MHHDASVDTVSGTTLVTVRVRNDAPVARRVRVRNRLDGPVFPPRREGVPKAGWDDNGYEGIVPAGGTVALGYACPVDADESGDTDPVAVESLGRADDAERADESDAVAEAVRSLGRSRPPADAVPDPTETARDDSDRRGAERRDADGGPDSDSPSTDVRDAADDGSGLISDDDGAIPDDDGAVSDDAATDLPDSVASWLAEVRARVARAERLTDASAADATEVLEEAGGFDGVSSLPAAVAADEETLRAFAARAERLADRAAAADAEPVVESVGRVA
ncbi:hypothetical protein SAMN04488063_0350 [Halopelagius inordinatus]|uniref:DUF8080 domain-containing protein n=1 Tax=Halopelagius inordinatus TaxID=553467 RepID=A0A1I2LPT5_9EURY|nr:hypothetical protein [Halopelagius inordinatus]SFF80449.1 hypothetical protein SAMN04488063_0350 [Halopelagius inordinatus]